MSEPTVSQDPNGSREAREPLPPQAPLIAGDPKNPLLAALAWARDLAVSVILAIVIILFLYRPVKVEGTSMMPALVDQERIFINQFVYKWGISEIERGDTIVFWFPIDPSKSYIKRVIGLPGDVVEIEDGVARVNGKVMEEKYVPEEYRDRTPLAPTKIPPDHYFVMGDHRSSSNDSRTWGPVHRRFIYGKAVFVYWPLEKMGMLR